MCTHVFSHTCIIQHAHPHIHPHTHAFTPTLTPGCQPQALLRAPSTPAGFSFLSVSGSLSVLLACLLFSWPSPLCPSICLCLTPLYPSPSSCYHSFSPSLPFSELSLLSGALSLVLSPSISELLHLRLSLFPQYVGIFCLLTYLNQAGQ